MKIAEAQLRKIIQEIILEGRRDFEQATRDINYFSEFEDPLFAEPASKKNIEPARNVKQAWAMAVDKIEEDPGSRELVNGCNLYTRSHGCPTKETS